MTRHRNAHAGRTERRHCAGKRAYGNWRSADDAITRLINNGAAATALNAYRCRHCRQIHVGHIPGMRAKR